MITWFRKSFDTTMYWIGSDGTPWYNAWNQIDIIIRMRAYAITDWALLFLVSVSPYYCDIIPVKIAELFAWPIVCDLSEIQGRRGSTSFLSLQVTFNGLSLLQWFMDSFLLVENSSTHILSVTCFWRNLIPWLLCKMSKWGTVAKGNTPKMTHRHTGQEDLTTYWKRKLKNTYFKPFGFCWSFLEVYYSL